MTTNTSSRTEITTFAKPVPPGIKVFAIDHHAPRENWNVRVGHWPFMTTVTLRAFEVYDGETLIGQFFNIPVKSKNGTISLDYSARYQRPDMPNSTYLGGFKTREAALRHVLKMHETEALV